MSKLSDFVSAGTADVELVRKPVITTPVDGETGAALSVTIDVSVFAPIYSVDTRSYREFQVQVSGGDWSTLFYSNQVNSDYDAFVGDEFTSYDIRVRDVLTDGYQSEWSDTVSIETPDIYVQNPTLSVEGSPSDVPETPTLTGSAFNIVNGTGTHQSTDWQILKQSDSSVVWESIGNTTNLEEITVPEGNLLVSTGYIFRVRYNSGGYGSSDWAEVSASTRAEFVYDPSSDPELTYDATTDTGFYGVETSANFISGDSLASQIGLSAGTSQNSTSDWLVFYVGENAPCNRTSPKYAYKLYVPMKTFRHSASWNDIDGVNAVYGDLNVTVGGETYECRLLTGAEADPTVDENGIGSEWNELIYRVHQDIPTDQVGNNWANYTDCDLWVGSSCGNGSHSWCQETLSSNTSYRVTRGILVVADLNTSAASFSGSNLGWRPGLAIPV